jgi:hypothetical protein
LGCCRRTDAGKRREVDDEAPGEADGGQHGGSDGQVRDTLAGFRARRKEIDQIHRRQEHVRLHHLDIEADADERH